MGFRLFKRVNLAGGLGLNVSKSGASLSVRTPLGTIGSKGVSIRTGIPGLTFRLKSLSEKVALSQKKQAILLINAEMDTVCSLGEDYGNKHDLFKQRWNGAQLNYASQEFSDAREDCRYLCEQGRELRQYLEGLVDLASQHRTGLTQTIRTSLTEFDKLHVEMENLLNNFARVKEEKDREAGFDKEAAMKQSKAVPPPIRLEAQSKAKEATLHFVCYSCEQPLEVNASATGQEFNCPGCGARLTVPDAPAL